ncbi:hypothetical protein [Schlesneria sp.]|uniref:hypothetical protein n=1 Tax=Schlesneria sp. TaxID=2762018 RepID=UPI002EDF2F3C
MKGWLSNAVIGVYLTAIFAGLAAQTMNFASTAHPVMYYFVWDMFCGWSSHEIRYHVVGEGESGTLYELAPGPWKQFMPYGDLPRTHYDVLGNSHRKMALNALARTEHEPIHRIVVIEEVWAKKYNMSDYSWYKRYDEPREPFSYFWQRSEMNEFGDVISNVPDYLSYLRTSTVADNPRLIRDLHQGRDHYVLTPHQRLSSEAEDY